MNIKHTIWTNDTSAYDMEEERAIVAERNGEDVENVTDEECYDSIRQAIDMCYDDERINLDKCLFGRVICIADLGLWNGRRSGYRLMGRNLNEVLHAFNGDYCTVGSDGENIVASDTHHDGTNYYTFREVIESEDIDALCEKLYDGTATDEDIEKYTRSLVPYMNDIYGWTPPAKSECKQVDPIARAA